MAKIDKDTEQVFNAWIDFLLPKEIDTPALQKLAEKSKLSFETLRKLKMRSRKGISTDTLIRLALARGASVESLTAAILRPKKLSKLDSSEVEWVKYGAKLTKRKRLEFLELIEFLKKTWSL